MKYSILANNEKVATMEGDFRKAESPLLFDDHSTPYQVGDFSHRKLVAAEMLLIWDNFANGSHKVSILTDDEGERFVLADITVIEGV